jgi:putative molybdopterin biosynthesis protein
MDKIKTLHNFEQLKILADARRLEILRLLMTKSATLAELGQMLKKSPAWVQHHLKILKSAGLIEITEMSVSARLKRKHYKAKASALILQELILPRSQKPIIIFAGSPDPAIEHIASHLAPQISILAMSFESLDSLIYLRQGLCHVAGTHLLETTGDYNTLFVRRLFQARGIFMVTLAYRTQGLIVALGNPKKLKALSDLTRKDITLINRNPGSEAQMWLDYELARLGLPIESVNGYENFVSTHRAAAQTVKAGKADVSIGVQSAAWEAQVDFIPLFKERYDLVIHADQAHLVSPLLDYIQTGAFRNKLGDLPGYDVTHTGEQVHLY